MLSVFILLMLQEQYLQRISTIILSRTLVLSMHISTRGREAVAFPRRTR